MANGKFIGDFKVVEKYTKNGEEKKFYHKVGSLYQHEDGSKSLMLIGGGWANFYPNKVNEGHFQEAKQAVQQNDFDSDIPF